MDWSGPQSYNQLYWTVWEEMAANDEIVVVVENESLQLVIVENCQG